MYGLPKGFETAQLVGLEMELVSFGAYSIHLNFDRSVVITIESGFAHFIPDDAQPEVASAQSVNESRLMQLTGKSVVHAEADEESTLTLVFSNGHRLYVYDDNPMYECYQINIGDERIIV